MLWSKRHESTMELSLLGLPLEKWQLMIFSIPIPSVVALASVSREIRVKAIEQVIWAKLFEYVVTSYSSLSLPLTCLFLTLNHRRDFDTSKEQIQDKCKLIKDWRLLYKHFYKNSIWYVLPLLFLPLVLSFLFFSSSSFIFKM